MRIDLVAIDLVRIDRVAIDLVAPSQCVFMHLCYPPLPPNRAIVGKGGDLTN